MWFIQNNIPTIYTKVLLDLLAERGFHPSSILRGTGLELSAIADPESKINLEQQLAIYENALRVSGIEGLGLLQALRTLLSYSTLSGALMDFQLQDKGDLHILSVNNLTAHGNVRQYIIEEHLAGLGQILKTISGGKFSASAVTFDYPPPKWASSYSNFFNCPVTFEQPTITYQFETPMLELDVVFSDPETARACELKCEEIISKMSDADSYVDKIRRIILMLPCSSRNLSSVAEEMNISSRSLRRKLADEQTTFQQLLDEVRLELALQYLENSSLPSEEIATLLGFSDGASFRHAFKKWTGIPPGTYRDQ